MKRKLAIAILLLAAACAPKKPQTVRFSDGSEWPEDDLVSAHLLAGRIAPWAPGDPEPETAIVWEDALTNGEQSADVIVCAHADLTLKPEYWFVHIRTWNWRPPTEEEKARMKE